MNTIKERIEKISSVLDEKKAENIEVIDLEGQDYITDMVIVATSLNEKHGHALLNELKNQLKPLGEKFLAEDDNGEWVVADLGDIIIHVMTQAYREKYTLEVFLDELKKGVYTSTEEV